jgi:hypothetical protein
MFWIKLVTENEAEGGHDFPWRLRRQRSEQYLTSAQTSAHFLRQKYGRPQQIQILLGSWDFKWAINTLLDWLDNLTLKLILS